MGDVRWSSWAARSSAAGSSAAMAVEEEGPQGRRMMVKRNLSALRCACSRKFSLRQVAPGCASAGFCSVADQCVESMPSWTTYTRVISQTSIDLAITEAVHDGKVSTVLD